MRRKGTGGCTPGRDGDKVLTNRRQQKRGNSKKQKKNRPKSATTGWPLVGAKKFLSGGTVREPKVAQSGLLEVTGRNWKPFAPKEQQTRPTNCRKAGHRWKSIWEKTSTRKTNCKDEHSDMTPRKKRVIVGGK